MNANLSGQPMGYPKTKTWIQTEIDFMKHISDATGTKKVFCGNKFHINTIKVVSHANDVMFIGIF